MKKVSVEAALEFAESHFPNGPEKLAELLEVEVRRSAIKGDGYCIPGGQRPIIRLNNSVSPRRQRFTLAHELGHIVLDIASVAGQEISELASNISEEEKQVNSFAGQILLPRSIAQSAVQRLPLSRKAIEKLAENANISRVFLVRRLTDLATDIGLAGAATFYYESQIYKWCHPPDAKTLIRKTDALLRQCYKQESQSWRIVRKEKAFQSHLFLNPGFDSQTIWMQIMRAGEAPDQTWEETLTRLETALFLNRQHLKQSFAGCMGSMKLKVGHLTTAEAVKFFNARYLHPERKWDAEFRALLLSHDGQEYLAMRLEEWTRRAED